MIARPYQSRTIEAVRASYHAGKRSIVVVLPTGAGKTFVATQLASPVLEKGLKVYFLVHREELAEQARKAFNRIGFRAGSNFKVVSLQTAVARDLRLTPALAIIDECHHVAADRWSKPVQSMRVAGVPIVGLSATPDRGDGRGLGDLFDDLIIGAQPSELLAAGHMVPCRVISPATPRKSLAEHPVTAYRKHLGTRRTVAFCGTVAYARKLARDFLEAGIQARCVDGQMRDSDRSDAIHKFRNGDLDVLTSVAVLTEGFDVPETSGIITTTGASYPSALIQKVGRGMRSSPGKVDCVHVDLRGAWIDLAMLPGEDRAFSLEGKAISAIPREYGDVIARCRRCGLLFLANEFRNSTCPECQAVRKGREDPRVWKARLAVVSARMPAEQRTQWLARKIIEGRSRRKKDGSRYKAVGWAIQQFAAKFRAAGGGPERPSAAVLNAAIRIADGGR